MLIGLVTLVMTPNVHSEGRAPLLRASLSTVLLALMALHLLTVLASEESNARTPSLVA